MSYIFEDRSESATTAAEEIGEGGTSTWTSLVSNGTNPDSRDGVGKKSRTSRVQGVQSQQCRIHSPYEKGTLKWGKSTHWEITYTVADLHVNDRRELWPCRIQRPGASPLLGQAARASNVSSNATAPNVAYYFSPEVDLQGRDVSKPKWISTKVQRL